MMAHWRDDERVVLTLDAGGTNLVFSAIQAGAAAVEPLTLPAQGHDLKACLANIEQGFAQVSSRLEAKPSAISFAFPGPADYPAGIIGDLDNLTAFRGGVALGPWLQERFGVPVFINNDGDLFAYGEALAGLLPAVNAELARSGSAKRFKNLLGLTLGTGFGGGIVRDGELFLGDNSGAAEVCWLRNRLEAELDAEEGCSIRAVRRVYAREARIPLALAPEPKAIYEIGLGQALGHRAAALEAFRQLGQVLGDALAQALTLFDALVVVGGGLAGAQELFWPAMLEAANGVFAKTPGRRRRLCPRVFDFEDPVQRERFLKGERRSIPVPGAGRSVEYDPLQRTAVGLSRLGTSEAVSVGAYAYALRRLG